MLRTIVIRTDLIKGCVTKAAKSNIIRAISTECVIKRKFNPSKCYTIRKDFLLPSQMQIMRLYSTALPSHSKIPLPALSPTMEEGTLVSWDKKEGDKLNEGDLLAEIETDKATMAFETPEEGYLAKILIPAGTKGIPVGKLVCIIVENQEDVAAFKDFKDDGVVAAKKAATAPPSTTATSPTPQSVPQPTPIPTTTPVSVPSTDSPASDRVYASPMARRLAEQRNIRLQGKGTGLFGSITSKDLDDIQPDTVAATATPQIVSGASFVDIPVSNIRSVIAKRLMQSKQTIPHYYLTVDINVDKLLELREKFNKKLERDGVKLSINDFVIKACAVASQKVPEANSAWLDTVIRQYKNVDVSIAVATDKGLITPIIFEANNKGVVDISKNTKELANKAREGKLQPHEFQGGTISVSNLGMFGVTHFSAIVNPPQSCIVAIGGTQKRLVEDNSEKGFKSANYLTATVSCDHRTVDGAVGARWLKVFHDCLEDPHNMIF